MVHGEVPTPLKGVLSTVPPEGDKYLETNYFPTKNKKKICKVLKGP